MNTLASKSREVATDLVTLSLLPSALAYLVTRNTVNLIGRNAERASGQATQFIRGIGAHALEASSDALSTFRKKVSLPETEATPEVAVELTPFEEIISRVETFTFNGEELTLRCIAEDDQASIMGLNSGLSSSERCDRFYGNIAAVTDRSDPMQKKGADLMGLEATALYDPEHRKTFVIANAENRVIAEATYMNDPRAPGYAEIHFLADKEYRHRVHENGPTIMQLAVERAMIACALDPQYEKGVTASFVTDNWPARNLFARTGCSERCRPFYDQSMGIQTAPGKVMGEHMSGFSMSGVEVVYIFMRRPNPQEQTDTSASSLELQNAQ